MKKWSVQIRKAIADALAHDIINTAKAAAYSGMLMLFPAVLVITTLLAQVSEGATFVGELRAIFEQVLPGDTMDLLQTAVLAHPVRSFSVIFSASSLSIFASMGMTLSLMEGFRRAYRLPPEAWSFWARRLRALLLVPIVLVPLAIATLVIIFGHQIELWMIDAAGHELRRVVLFSWRMVRWSIALATSMTVLSVLYHFGTKRTESWRKVVPGAIAGTLIWFPATLAFGWYVTRDQNYSRFYGPFAAGIATLVWIYLSALSVLVGAELNGMLYANRQERSAAAALSESTPSGQ